MIGALRRAPDDETPAVAANAFAVAGVTIANGADNIAVYTPTFRTIGAADTAVTIAVFTVLVAVWCAAAWSSCSPDVPGWRDPPMIRSGPDARRR